MSLLRITYYGLWVGSNILSGVLVALMTWRRVYERFPVFFTFICFDLLSSGALFIIYHWVSYKAYFVAYWVYQGICLALGIAVIREVMLRIFKQYEALQELSILIFRWVAVILLLVAILSAAAAPGSDADRMLAGLFVMDRSVRLVQVGLLLFILLFSSYFKLSWKNYAFAIALGLGVVASVELSAVAIRAKLGPISGDTYSLVTGTAQAVAVLIWSAYLLVPERHERIEVLPKADLQVWNQALLELLHR